MNKIIETGTRNQNYGFRKKRWKGKKLKEMATVILNYEIKNTIGETKFKLKS